MTRRDATRGRHPGRRHCDQNYRIELPAGWTVTARNVNAEVESTSLSGPDDAGCLVQVFGAGQDPRLPTDTQPVTVQGGPGLYGVLDPDYNTVRSGVSWHYRADA